MNDGWALICLQDGLRWNNPTSMINMASILNSRQFHLVPDDTEVRAASHSIDHSLARLVKSPTRLDEVTDALKAAKCSLHRPLPRHVCTQPQCGQ